jgi:peptidylprolyl isomerase
MRLILAAAACALAVLPAAAKTAAGTADQVIARSGSTSFTADQLRSLVAALPDDSRAKVVSDPAALAELLRSAVLQNELLADARAKGWDRRPEVAAEIERARQAIIVRGFVASQVPPPAAPTDAQISAAYDANKARFMLPRQYHLAQIFVAVPATDTPGQIDRVRARLAGLRIALSGKPAEFAETAKRLSDDKRSAPGGGDLGWLREDALAEPIKTAVAGLPEGSVSDPLRTPDGWHLIELITTRPAGPAPLEQVKPALVQAIQQQERQAATRAYLDAQLKRDPVEINEVALSQIAKSAAKP